MFVRTYAGAIVGIDAVTVAVEVNIAGGGLGLYLVGLPDNAVKESEQRIRAAFENSGERFPGRKVVDHRSGDLPYQQGMGQDGRVQESRRCGRDRPEAEDALVPARLLF